MYRLVQAAYYIARNRRRRLGADFHFLISRLPSSPSVADSQNLPSAGPLVLVANHYQRPGLWMGWTGMALARSVHEHTAMDLRVVAIAEWTDYRIGPIPIPSAVTRIVFARFFSVFGFIPMEAESSGPRRRAEGVRRVVDAVRAGAAIALFPEGGIGETAALIPAQTGTGAFLLALASRGAPIIPVGIFEAGARLTIVFGPPVDMTAARAVEREGRDRVASDMVMTAIAELLPEWMRGVYGSSSSERED